MPSNATPTSGTTGTNTYTDTTGTTLTSPGQTPTSLDSSANNNNSRHNSAISSRRLRDQSRNQPPPLFDYSEIQCPPGRLGLVLDTQRPSDEAMARGGHNNNTFVYHVRSDSVLRQVVKKGDEIISVGGLGCEGKGTKVVTELMAKGSESGGRVITIRSRFG